MNDSTTTPRNSSFFFMVRYGLRRTWFELGWLGVRLARAWERNRLRKECAREERFATRNPAHPDASPAKARAAFIHHELSLFPVGADADRAARLKRLRIVYGLDTPSPQEGA